MESVLNQKLYDYCMQLNEAEKKSVLFLLQTFMQSRTEINVPINIDQYNEEIDEALAEEQVRNYITQEEMEKSAAKW